MSLTKKIKEAVAQQANYCCEYCRSQEKYSPSRFSVDHILPTAKMGDDELNIADKHPLLNADLVMEAIRYAARFAKNEIIIEVQTAA